jgi:hypothetical protein
MRNSHVDIRANAPDTSDLDIGWDFEPDTVELPDEPVDSLLPSHSSIRPSRASRRPRKAASRARTAPPTLARSRRLLFAASLVASAGIGACTVAVVQHFRGAPAANSESAIQSESHELAPAPTAAPAAPARPIAASAIAASAPPLLDAPDPPIEPIAATSPIVPIVPAPRAGADSPAPIAERRPILVQVDPPSAEIFVDGKRLGNDLVNVELSPGQHKRATIKLPGYRSRAIELDGTTDFIHVTLVPIPRAKAHSRAPGDSAPSMSTAASAASDSVSAPVTPAPENPNTVNDRSSSEADLAYPQ